MEIIRPSSKEKKLLISQAPYGIPFTRCQDSSTIMRVKPTSFLLNSTLVGEVLNRGDVFIVNLVTGTLFSIKGTEEVKLLSAKLIIEVVE